MMVDSVAYVADQLNFYLDYNVNEAFLDSSFQFSNILRHGRVLGYKHNLNASTYGEVSLYAEVPASDSGLGPDMKYMPIMSRGTRFNSSNGISYTLLENVNFNDPSNPMVVARVNASTGTPTHYAIKAYGNVVSGRLAQKTISIGPFQRFRTVALGVPNVAEIISVFDAEGNQYYEVDYLSQDMIFEEIANPNYKNDNVPSIIKPLLVSRKFILERRGDTSVLQFGSGEAAASSVIANPQEVAIDVFGKNYVTDITFDPTRLSKNSSYGIVPENTTLFVTYRLESTINKNVAVGALNGVSAVLLDFENSNLLDTTKVAAIKESIEVSNEKPIIGSVTRPGKAEVKRRIMDTFPTQNRAVTQNDYESVVYRMPSKFGSVKRCSIQKDQDSLRRNLNL